MSVITVKQNHYFNDQLWFVILFNFFKRRSAILILNNVLLLSGNLCCQCSTSDCFGERISLIYNSPVKKTENQLKELLQLQQQMKACHLEKDSSFMFLLQKIGVLYFEEFDYLNAINVTNQSIYIAKECIINNCSNTLLLANNYYNLFGYYDALGQTKKKYEVIDSCIAYSIKGNSGFDMTIAALADKTEYLFNKGEYSLCSKNAKLGEDITQKYYHGLDSIQYIVFFVDKQANALYFSKDVLVAEKLLETRILQFKQAGNGKQLYTFYSLLGLINRDKKNYTKALSYFQQAYKLSSIIEFRKGCALNLGYIGLLYARNFNNHYNGLNYCQKALKYADSTDSLSVIKQIANIYVLKGMYDKAQYFFQQAYNTVQHGMNEITMLQNSFQFPGFNLLQTLSDLTTDKGDAYLQQYYHTKNDSFLKKALDIYKKGDLFLVKIKKEQQLQLGSNLVRRTTARNLYEHAIEACYANRNIEDAFYFFEKSRAVLLNDQINEQQWMADADIAKQASIKKTIIELERKLATVPASSEDYLTIQRKLYSTSQELEVLTRNIKDKNPALYKNYHDTGSITLLQVRKNILNNSKTLVEIFSGEEAIYVLTITPVKQSLIKINKQLYDSLTNSFNSFITSRELLNRNFSGFVKTAHQLYNLLFQSTPVYSSIIISPDGVSFPFEAFVVNKDNQKPDYFLNHYATSYTYSVKYLTNQFAVNTNGSDRVLGIAPVQYKNYLNLATLTGSDHSLENINKYFSEATNFVYEKATRSNFLQNFPRYNIIQLYTHAADSSINNDPVIYFADSALYLSDLIPDSRPVTQLVVLSACETANGKLYQGEGIFSFNRGFAALGIPAAISNLWSVENESTYLITELFYKYLSQGLPTDVALQQAKVEFINNSSSKEKKLPFFWAGAILTGKVDTIKSNGKPSWLKYIGGATMLLLATAYITTRKSIRAAK